jgi:hypothetical protein
VGVSLRDSFFKDGLGNPGYPTGKRNGRKRGKPGYIGTESIS